MRILFDTHTLLWFLTDDPKLPKALGMRLVDSGTLFFSPVSILEIAIKHSLKPDVMPCDPNDVMADAEASGIAELPFTARHGLAVGALPWLHRDPFDRMLLAQARTEGIPLLTHDEAIVRYGEGVFGF